MDSVHIAKFVALQKIYNQIILNNSAHLTLTVKFLLPEYIYTGFFIQPMGCIPKKDIPVLQFAQKLPMLIEAFSLMVWMFNNKYCNETWK